MDIQIHRGARQIGGTAVEIAAGRTRLLIDCGSELNGAQGTISDASMRELLRTRQFDAVLLTHYHGDHIGLLDAIPEDMPIYMSPAIFTVLKTQQRFLKQPKMQALLDDAQGRLHIIPPGGTFLLGDFAITPYYVDHSAYYAYMYVLEAEGKVVLHSGDFRAHGKLGGALKKLLPRLVRRHHSIDVLLVEGTLLGRNDAANLTASQRDGWPEVACASEAQLEAEALHLFQRQRQNFIICSSTNFDSLDGFCRAAAKAHLPIYAQSHLAAQMKAFPGIEEKHRNVYHLPDVTGRPPKKLMKDRPQEFVCLIGTLMNPESFDYYADIMRMFPDAQIIYSMWTGYLRKGSSACIDALADFVGSWPRGAFLHTSGHAKPEDLKWFIETLQPRGAILPMHSMHPEELKNIGVSETLVDRMICFLQDGDVYHTERNYAMKTWMEKEKKERLLEPERKFDECVQAIVLLHHKAQTCTVYLRTWHFPKMSIECEFDWRQYNGLQCEAEVQASGQDVGIFRSDDALFKATDVFETLQQGDMQRADIDEDTSIVTMNYFAVTPELLLCDVKSKNVCFELERKRYTITNFMVSPV